MLQRKEIMGVWDLFPSSIMNFLELMFVWGGMGFRRETAACTKLRY